MIIQRVLWWALLMLFLNLVLVAGYLPGAAVAVVMGLVLAVFYLAFNIAPVRAKGAATRLRVLRGGYELMFAAIVCVTLELALYAVLLIRGGGWQVHLLVINGVVCALLLAVLLINGFIRIATCSHQVGMVPKVCLLLWWWVPVVNVALLKIFLSKSRKEYDFTTKKHQINRDRKHLKLCETKYPILMVHGIFFRDWQNFNYWGRIPGELEENGATIYYGSHQSSASVEQCGGELARCIRQIVEETGCEKVNIIAHSKGGLDSRYAVSCLGAGQHVASLTTICTPHQGCNYVGKLLDIIPSRAISFIGQKYKSIYTKLGDDSPDFFSGLRDLTDRECIRLNREMPDAPDVLYQSVGAQMRSPASAMFPMNVGCALIKLFGGGDNDGLTSVESMAWGDYLGVLRPKRKQGISHGDVIDLTRKDVEGFDVCEFYVDLVSKLKKQGL